MRTETGLASEKWYVVQCKPRREAHAAGALRDCLGLTTYVPEVIRRARGEERQVPFFPGYLFVLVDLQDVQRSTINSAPGVLHLLEFGNRPQPVPPATVQRLRERLDELNAQGGLRYDFSPGDQVLLTSGPLKGLEAAFVGPATGKARVKVLLYFLGRLSEAQVDVGELEPAPGWKVGKLESSKVATSQPTFQPSTAHYQRAPSPRRQRRTTRGKGRRIR